MVKTSTSITSNAFTANRESFKGVEVYCVFVYYKDIAPDDAEGDTLATFAYHGDGSRATMHIEYTATQYEQRDYFGDRFQRDTRNLGSGVQQKTILYLGGTPYNAPAALVKDYGSNQWQLLHILRDNLGSITHIVDTTGTVVQELSYTPWGALRDPATLQPYLPDSQPDLLLDRGFTGHEHLTAFGLINMNVRLYDPAAGRFLSPDPYVQAPDNTQNLNRYTYCLNNPLRYVDPTGEAIWRTDDPDEIRSILEYITGKGYRNVTIEGIQNIWNPNRWTEIPDDAFNTQDDKHLIYFTFFESGGGNSGVSDVSTLISPVVYGIRFGTFHSIADATMPRYDGADVISMLNTTISGGINQINNLTDLAVELDLGKTRSIGNPKTWFKKVSVDDYIKTFDKPTASIAKVMKFVSRGFTIVSVIETGVNVSNDVSSKHWVTASLRVGATALVIGANFIPVIGPILSTSIALTESIYGEDFYDYMENKFGN